MVEEIGKFDEIKQQLEQRSRQLEAVFKITSALHNLTDLDEMLRQTLETSLDVADADAGSILLHDTDDDLLVFRFVIGEKAQDLIGLSMPPDKGIAGSVFQSGNPQISEQVARDKRHMRDLAEQIQYAAQNMVTVPLKDIERNPIGVMQILNKRDIAFDEHDVEVLSIMATTAGTAIENARLFQSAQLAIMMHLLGDISHDIKNMLTPVVTSAQTLGMIYDGFEQNLKSAHNEPGESVEATLAKIDAAVEPLRSFVSEALQMIEDGSLSIQERVREIADCMKGIVAEPLFEIVDVNKIASIVLQALKAVADRRGVELILETTDGAPRISIDQKRIYNALYNLVNNAIPETLEGGRITVRTSAVMNGATFPEGHYFRIDVADTGNGMPPHVKERLFTDKAVSTKPGGTGLGTRIVKNVIDAHGGIISVESEENKGTTFSIRLPLEQETDEPSE